VAMAGRAMIEGGAPEAGVHAGWVYQTDAGTSAALWMLAAGLVLALAGSALSLGEGHGKPGGRAQLVLPALMIPLGIGLLLVGQWLEVKAAGIVGAVLLPLAAILFWVLRAVGKVPVAPNARTDPNYSVLRPWSYDLVGAPGSSADRAKNGQSGSSRSGSGKNGDGARTSRNSENGRAHSNTTRWGNRGPEKTVVVSNWPATLVGWLVIPGVLASCVMLGWGRVWLFVGGSVVSLTVPWFVSRRMVWRRLCGTRYEGRATAAGPAAAPIALVLVLVGSFLAAALAGALYSAFAPWPFRFTFGQDYGDAIALTMLGLVWVAVTAFCVPMFGRRSYAAATTRAWLSWGAYMWTLGVMFVAADGWPAAGSRWQGWGQFMALTVVVTLMVWQLRRVRPPRQRRDKA
jgi:hypothetical protein